MKSRSKERLRLKRRLLYGLLFSACISVCLSGSLALFALPCRAANGQTVIIQIVGTTHTAGFLPPLTTVHVNDTVIFVNQAFPVSTYLVSADDGSFTSPSLFAGMRWAMKFTTPGTHVYRDRSYPQTMVGEILVVDASVALLPTPVPAVEATALALIKAGQSPPDNLAPPVKQNRPKPATRASSFNAIPIAITVAVLLLVSLLGMAFYEIRKQKTYEESLSEETAEEYEFSDYLALGKRAFQRVMLNTRQRAASVVYSLRQRLARRDDDDDDGSEDDRDAEREFTRQHYMDDTLV